MLCSHNLQRARVPFFFHNRSSKRSLLNESSDHVTRARSRIRVTLVSRDIHPSYTRVSFVRLRTESQLQPRYCHDVDTRHHIQQCDLPNDRSLIVGNFPRDCVANDYGCYTYLLWACINDNFLRIVPLNPCRNEFKNE